MRRMGVDGKNVIYFELFGSFSIGTAEDGERSGSIVRGGCGRIQRGLEIGQFDVVQAGVMGEHDHLELVFVYGVVVDLPALRKVKDHRQLLLIPVGVSAQ